MDVKITLIDEGNEGRKVMVSVADDKGTNVSSQELQTVGAGDTEKPTLPTETQFKLPAGGSVKVVEENSPLVYDGDQRATYHPDSDAAAEQKAPKRTGPVHPKTGQPAGPSKVPGDMTANEAQGVRLHDQAEGQKTGVNPTVSSPQSTKVDEKKGTVDMSKTVSPSPTHVGPPTPRK